MISNIMSDRLAPEVQEWVIAENMKLPRESAATLLFNHSLEDWRDVLPRINIPGRFFYGQGGSQVLASVGDRVDRTTRLCPLLSLDERTNEDDSLALFAGDPRPVVGIGRIR